MYKEVNCDIKSLEYCSKRELYDKLWEIVKDKWKELECNKFLEYFEKTWIVENSRWSNCFRALWKA